MTVSVGASWRSVSSRRRIAPARSLIATTALWLFALLLSPHGALADARSDYLVRLLAGSTQFRVRAQAAISLGSVEPAASVVSALSKALSDEHPAVRAAAANSLGRL